MTGKKLDALLYLAKPALGRLAGGVYGLLHLGFRFVCPILGCLVLGCTSLAFGVTREDEPSPLAAAATPPSLALPTPASRVGAGEQRVPATEAEAGIKAETRVSQSAEKGEPTEVSESLLPLLDAETSARQLTHLPEALLPQTLWWVVGFTANSKVALVLCQGELSRRLGAVGYLLAVAEGLPFFLRDMIKNAVINGVPEALREHLLLLESGKQVLQALTHFSEQKSDEAYILGLSPKGDHQFAVRYVTHSRCLVEQQVTEIVAALQSLRDQRLQAVGGEPAARGETTVRGHFRKLSQHLKKKASRQKKQTALEVNS